MSVPAESFVIYGAYQASQINNTPAVICPAFDCVTILDSIILSSDGQNPTFVNIFTQTEVSEGVFAEDPLFEGLNLNPPQVLEVIKDSIITLNPGEALYAYSDDSSKRFNSRISYRSLTELTGDGDAR